MATPTSCPFLATSRSSPNPWTHSTICWSNGYNHSHEPIPHLSDRLPRLGQDDRGQVTGGKAWLAVVGRRHGAGKPIWLQHPRDLCRGGSGIVSRQGVRGARRLVQADKSCH